MADATDPTIPQSEAEIAYQANLLAARERLLKVEAAMDVPQPLAQPTPQTIPASTVVPIVPVTGFSLSALKNPTGTGTGPAPSVAPPPAAPLPDISAIPAAIPLPAPKAENPLTKQAESATAPEHLQPVRTPPPRSMPSRLKPLLSAVIVFFVVLAAFKAPVYYYQLKFLFGSPQTSTQTTPGSSQIAAAPTLTIPKINVSAPVIFEPSITEANVQKALESGVVHYGNTAKPGEVGNSVIFGHSSNDWDKPGGYKFIFVLIEKLAVGDTYSVDYKGVRYEYQIYERRIIPATEVSVVAPTVEATSTLITCWPTGTTQKRLIVRAKQVSPQPAARRDVAQVPALNQVNTVLPGTDSNNGLTGTVNSWIEDIRAALRGDTIDVSGN